MTGMTDLNQLLRHMQPRLRDGEYVFCTTTALDDALLVQLKPLATFREDEGLTLILERNLAREHGFEAGSVFRAITLTVHSSLEAVGLTAAVAGKLAEKGISANVVAAYYHDHIFVQAEKAQLALDALAELSAQ
ncbi:ACT domain-containing protein [Photobacterium atrarenae]|uniref:ACT domain-containing protein n=1 Tax=Photobacterium atrarenae TaxID=865757 RepID=A0ABY5GL18_9GAMM|nr:ACT domain-containing protein [Photobacterium atrarenae]UTV30004.1 ACT domain-containing protein [Photobacterium atrarenae]